MQFKLINDITQSLNNKIFGPNWLSLGVASKLANQFDRERYYFLLMNKENGKTYIEEYVDAPNFFVLIEDQKLWNDLYLFFYEKGLITLSKNKEFKIAKMEK